MMKKKANVQRPTSNIQRPTAEDPSRTGGIARSGIKIRRFKVVDPKGLTRHGRKLPKGCPFWVKKSSSTSHVDRWLAEGRIKEVG